MVERLQRRRIRVVMTEVRPADKAATIQTLQQAGQVVADSSLGVPIAALGWLKPMVASAAMALSSQLVIVQSSLLLSLRGS